MKLNQFFAFLLFIIGFTSCKKENATNTSKINDYYEYISEVTKGIINNNQPVSIILNKPVEGWTEKQELDSSILSIEPKVKGKVYALNNYTLSFVPDNKFEQNTTYTFSLDLDQVTDERKNVDRYFKFSVKTLKQQFSLYTYATKSYSKNWQYIDGEMLFSDFINLETAKNIVKVYQNDKELKVKFSEIEKNAKKFNLIIDSIQRLEDDSKLEVKWSGKDYGIDNEGSNLITIPGLNNFSISGVKVPEGDTQAIEISFSDPIKKDQNFDGLITLGNANLKFTVLGNILKVYPKKIVKGEVKLKVHEGVKSTDNFSLKDAYEQAITFTQFKPEIKLLDNGNILPNSNNLKINFKAVNLKAVDVSVLKIYENNILQFLQTNNLNGSSSLQRVGRPIARKRIYLNNNPT